VGGLDSITTPDGGFNAPFIDAVTTGRWSDVEPWTCGMENNSLATAPFPRENDTPTMIVISGDDQLVWHESVRNDVPNLCDEGYDLSVIECAGASHSEGAVTSLHLQWRWVLDRLAGTPATDTCVLPTPIDCAATP